MNEENFQHHIDTILAHLDEQHAREAGQQHPTTDEQEASSQQQHPRTIIDVYVLEREEEEPLIVESTLGPAPQESQNDDESEVPTPPPPLAPHRTRPRWWMLACAALCLLLLAGAGTSIYLLQLFTPSATITLVTTAQQLTTTSAVQVITNGAADPTKNQVPRRVLPAITMSQQQTVPTTGTTHQDATSAHGFITFYNAAPYVQTIKAGTMLTGADGIQVITDQDAAIPAAVMPTEGQTTIVGHAATTGPQGNIRAGDVYGQCCRLNVFVANGMFHGGQDAQTYQSVTQQDINSVVSSVKTSLEHSIQTALKMQVQPTETIATPLACTQKVTPDHRVGEAAAQVSVTVDETCQGLMYTTQEMTTLTTQRATQDAMQRFGTGYTTTGVQTSSITVRPNQHDNVELQVISSSMWSYRFDAAQQQAIKAMIAGMSKDKAITTLLHLSSVQSVSLTLMHGTTLPTDIQQIHLLFLQVQ